MEIKLAGVDTAGNATDDGFILSGVTVVDTRTGDLTPNMDVLTVRGKIQRIVPAGSLPG